MVVGRLTFREDGDPIDCRRMGVGGKAIPPNIDKVRRHHHASPSSAPLLRSPGRSFPPALIVSSVSQPTHAHARARPGLLQAALSPLFRSILPPPSLPPALLLSSSPPQVDAITSDAMFILLVEKDAAFMRLAEDRFYNTYPCIIITAKGQPDVATR